MEDLKLCESEYRFMMLIWDAEPLTSRQLVELALEQLGWKKSTTYTVLKKMCLRGILNAENKMVTVLIPKDEFHAMQSEQFVEQTYQGSLPAFIAAFTTRKQLSKEDLDAIQKMIDSYQ